jgi:RNA polymerase sigma-70 factor (ECF subfamily)
MTHDENDLVRRFRTGDAGSFETLYRDYGVRIYRFCLRLCGNEADAEDLTQEVFLAAYKGLDRFTGRSTLATWLYRIALYRRRSASGLRRPQTVPLDESRLPSSSDPAQVGMDRMALDNALRMLPENLRIAFLLVKEEGLLCREAAEALGIPEGTLKSRVYAAVVQLQRLLETEESATPQKQPAGVTQTREMTNEL